MRSVLPSGAMVLALALSAGQGFAQPAPLPQTLPPQTLPSLRPAIPAESSPKVAPEEGARASLDKLFERLAATKTAEEAKGIAGLIQRRWARSGSDTADLLMGRAQEALKSTDHELAIEILDRLVLLEPDWAEGWNQRANAFYLAGDPVRSMLDIGETLRREPRHFGALAGLGVIMRSQGRDKDALKAYRGAIAVHPHLEGLKDLIEGLKLDVDGRDA